MTYIKGGVLKEFSRQYSCRPTVTTLLPAASFRPSRGFEGRFTNRVAERLLPVPVYIPILLHSSHTVDK